MKAMLSSVISVVCGMCMTSWAQDAAVVAPQGDLVPVAAEARTEPVRVCADAGDPALMAIVAGDARAAAVEHPGFRDAAAWAAGPTPDAAGGNATGDQPSVLVSLVFDIGVAPDELAEVLEKAAAVLADAWYAESATVVRAATPGETVDGNPGAVTEPAGTDDAVSGSTADAASALVSGQVRVVLAAVDCAVEYWRVAVPVRQIVTPDAAGRMVPIAANTAGVAFDTPTEDTNRERYVAMIPVGIDAVMLNSEDGNDDAEATSAADTTRSGPYHHHATAVGYIRHIHGRHEIAVTVDCTDRVSETDEQNNRAAIALPESSVREDLWLEEPVLRPVWITAVAEDELLRQLVTGQVALFSHRQGVDGWITVTSGATWSAGEAFLGLSAGTTVSYDLVVALVPNGGALPDDLGEGLAEWIGAQWYADSATVISNPANDPVTVAGIAVPVNLRIGVTLSMLDVARPYWCVEATAVRHAEPVGFADPPPRRRIAAVAATVTENDDSAATGVVSLPARGSTRTTLLLARGVGTAERDDAPAGADADAEGLLTIDPDDAIEEVNEENNTAELHWGDPGPGPGPDPIPSEDLFPVDEHLRGRLVTCVASTECPVLVQLLRQTATAELAHADGFLSCQVMPWHGGMVGVGRLVNLPEGHTFDAVITAGFLHGDAQAAMSALIAGLEEQWFVAEAIAVNLTERWTGRQRPEQLQWGAVAVTLTHSEQARRYWRVSVPVVRAMQESVATVNVDGARAGWLEIADELINRFAGDVAAREEYDVLGEMLPRLVEVQVSGSFAADDGTHQTGTVSDHVWLLPGGHGRALALLEVHGEPLDGMVTVDPKNAIAETDEENNRAAFQPPVAPPPATGVFEAWARIVEPAAADGVAHARDDVSQAGPEAAEALLVVHAQLSNPTDAVIELTFTSGLTIDFQLDDYRWSADKAFPMVVTTTRVAPGSSLSWSLQVPLAEVAWTGDETELEVFLVNSDYRDLLPFPPPVDGLDGDLPDEDPGDELEAIDDLIVTDAGVDLAEILGVEGRQLLDTLLEAPWGGDISGDAAAGWYRALEGFLGEDHLYLEDHTTGKRVLRRLKVGLQPFSIHLDEGWNAVSFPIVPTAELEELLARVPGGSAWGFRRGRYVRPEDIEVGEGLLIYSREAMELEFVGEPQAASERPLSPGWNLVGPVNDLDWDTVPGIAKAVDWQRGRYTDRARTRSGEGCWVYVEGDEPVAVPLR